MELLRYPGIIGLDTLETVHNLDRPNKGLYSHPLKVCLNFLQRFFLDTQRKEVLHWLCSIDPSTNHNAAHATHEPNTGTWLTKSQEFDRWWTGANRFLFLIGIPGSGKTVLCSTIIEHIRDLRIHSSGIGFAYYYFDFNDERKQTIDGFLSSVLTQLSYQTETLPDGVRYLHEQSSNGSLRPKRAALIDALFSVAKSYQKVYIIVDALDECQDRTEVVTLIMQIVNIGSKNIHLMGTSRRERDLESVFQDNRSQTVSLTGAFVDKDIALYVRSKLSRDRRLQAWPGSVKDEIETVLIEKACGMYANHLKT